MPRSIQSARGQVGNHAAKGKKGGRVEDEYRWTPNYINCWSQKYIKQNYTFGNCSEVGYFVNISSFNNVIK